MKIKRAYITRLVDEGILEQIVVDRVGSRVADGVWDAADVFLKEKIARALMPREHELAGSQYGKFFIRKLGLGVLRRDREAWRSAMVKTKAPEAQPRKGTGDDMPPRSSAAPASQSEIPGEEKSSKDDRKKRKKRGRDEIDELFDTKLGKKLVKAALETAAISSDPQPEAGSHGHEVDGHEVAEEPQERSAKKKRKHGRVDRELGAILDAVRDAPAKLDQKKSKKKS